MWLVNLVVCCCVGIGWLGGLTEDAIMQLSKLVHSWNEKKKKN